VLKHFSDVGGVVSGEGVLADEDGALGAGGLGDAEGEEEQAALGVGHGAVGFPEAAGKSTFGGF
jgi:hypothetical protein